MFKHSTLSLSHPLSPSRSLSLSSSTAFAFEQLIETDVYYFWDCLLPRLAIAYG